MTFKYGDGERTLSSPLLLSPTAEAENQVRDLSFEAEIGEWSVQAAAGG